MTPCPTPRIDRDAPSPATKGPAAPTIQMVTKLQRELQKKQRFASDASHELRTAVAGLRAELEEASLHPDQTDLGDLLGSALRDVDRLDAIITDLRVLAEMESGLPCRPQRIDLADLVREETSRRTDGIAVGLRLERGVTVEAVPIRISRLLTNLLDNAQRHARHLVEIVVTSDGDSAELTVSDDGDGIAEEERDLVFQRFTRLKAARLLDGAGTGLGLAIARDIAHAHVGSLHVRDAEAGGACFVLRLPLAGPIAPASRCASTVLDP
ncbi:His Kinase A (phospho-acceptor) domain-containing protein [Nonomuraea maritima]|uniref:histidine kinase n=2 Tax=Nonomuraea maritima TaxID=683260 RepID=A0A1G9JLB0_9ACTN|nr:His Kinase A (phospho-acceptor) domain-containing protein [Nonomuraea maritima]